MKKNFVLLLMVFFSGAIFFVSCKKEYSCEGCANKPPVANAGPDQSTSLPTDSLTLDGSASSDPDGTISSFSWVKVSGPASYAISTSSAPKTIVKNLVAGVYRFALTVTDNGGLSASDTMQVLVDDPFINQPPVANAGPDQAITLPVNTVNLDGSASSDPDNNIIIYTWTKIEGPSTFTIASANTVQTQVSNLVQGIYQFELKVTDAGLLFSTDTVKVSVESGVIIVDCNGITRPEINAQLISAGFLSQTRESMAVASAGSKILFAGGFIPSSGVVSSRVDIYDIPTNSWTTAELSQARTGVAAVVLGNKIFFAGGGTGINPSSRVDIYDVAANSWTTRELSVARTLITAAAAGNKVVFAGGFDFFGPGWSAPPVDIYDATANTWTTDSLRNRPTAAMLGDAGITATVIGTKIFFAGNASDWFAWDFGSITSTINIYETTTGNWTTTDLSIARGFMAGIAVGNKNYWAGGLYSQPQMTYGPFTNLVEIRDMSTGTSSFGCLFQPNAFFTAVQKNSQIVFFTSGIDLTGWPEAPRVLNKFDIYDIPSDKWSVGVLPVNIYGASVIAVNNTIYVAGGNVNGLLSDRVWKLEY